MGKTASRTMRHITDHVCIALFADSEGRTPLHWAVDRGHLDVVEVLLKGEADVNAKVHIHFALDHTS